MAASRRRYRAHSTIDLVVGRIVPSAQPGPEHNLDADPGAGVLSPTWVPAARAILPGCVRAGVDAPAPGAGAVVASAARLAGDRLRSQVRPAFARVGEEES